MTIDNIMEYIDKNPKVNKKVIKGMIEQLISGLDAEKEEVPQIQLEELFIQKNGLFKAPEGKGYSKVIVSVKSEE